MMLASPMEHESEVIMRVVFDLANVGYKECTFVIFGLIFIFIGLFLVRYAHRIKVWDHFSKQSRRVFAFVFLGFALVWTFAAFALSYSQYRSVYDKYQKGDYQIADGIVHNFVPMPYSGHSKECFSVNWRRFCYADGISTPGFNNTQSHGGPIRSGLHVRVSYVDETIVKLEVDDE
jgi:hypothetical protein